MPDAGKQKVALVTGAASGIGRAAAIRFIEEGWSAIALVDRDGALMAKVAAELEAVGGRTLQIVADLGDLARMEQVMAEAVAGLGRVDSVVNCAAVARPAIAVVDYDTVKFTQDMSINVTAGFVLARDAARHMIAAGRPGTIVFIASINAQGAGVGSVGYCASKAAVITMMKVLAAELGESGIRVNTVSPGPTDTPRSVSRVGEKVMEKLRQRFDGAAIRRLGEAREIADACVYLCSERSSYISGHDLVVDGGLMASVYVAAKPE